jgi:hypothetical protein
MKIDFIENVFLVLKKHFSDEQILNSTNSSQKYKNIETLKKNVLIYLSDTNIELSKREGKLSDWLSNFFNRIELFEYNLEKFNNFYTETEALLRANGFIVETLTGYDITYNIKTPSNVKYDEELEEAFSGSDIFEQERILESLKIDKKVASYNQELIISFMEYSDEYLKILKKYFTANETDYDTDRYFVKTVRKMKDTIETLSLGISRVSSYSFNIAVPLESLYTLEEDWSRMVERERVSGSFGHRIVKDYNLTYENLRSLIAPFQRTISSFIIEDFSTTTHKRKTNTSFYIEKIDDDFKYKGKLLPLSKKADYYKVFCALYALLPSGGEVKYKDLIKEIKSRIPKTKSKSEEEMRKFIQANLTEKGNGFMRYSKLPDTMDNQKPIIETIREFGISFNNKIG